MKNLKRLSANIVDTRNGKIVYPDYRLTKQDQNSPKIESSVNSSDLAYLARATSKRIAEDATINLAKSTRKSSCLY